ncbi:MAG: DUF885 domain-containing protein [Proteobacteria bacterium]|nr:DUF885 domain-containing protein [Pseudomonadota bacterium]
MRLRSPVACVSKGFLGAVALLLAACGPKAAAPPAAPVLSPEQQFAALERRYVIFVLKCYPVVSTYLGGSEFDPTLADNDGRLRDYSADGVKDEDARLGEFRDQFTGLDPAALTPRRRIDRNVALAEIEFLLHQHQVLRHQERALDSYVDEPFRGVDWQIQGMTSTGSGTYGTESEWQMVIARARAVPAYLANAEAQLAAGVAAKNAPDWRMLRDHGLVAPVADAEYFAKTLPQIAATDIASAHKDALLGDLQKAGDDAAAAYRHLRKFVADTFFDNPNGTDATALKPEYRADHFAFGRTEYDWALHNNLGLDTTANDLFLQAASMILESREQMIALAREVAKSHKWHTPIDGSGIVRSVFDQLSHDAPRNDDEMLADYRKTGERLVAYARATGIFDVPSEYQLDVTVTPPPLRAGLDGAAYYPAPPFKKTGVGRFYVTPTGNDQALLRREHNKAAMPDLAAHEGFPGHDWHYKVMTQYRDDISPLRWLTPGAVEDSSSMWQDSMASEGWALYSEALLSEPQPSAPHGFYTPEERLYQLRGKLYRDLRVRIDTGLHLGLMQFEEAVTLFSETVDFIPGSCTDARALKNPDKRVSCDSARRAVTRYSRWPTQAITYRLGKDQILALRKRMQAKLGATFSEKQFHLEFMKQGTIPATYFADELLNGLQK